MNWSVGQVEHVACRWQYLRTYIGINAHWFLGPWLSAIIVEIFRPTPNRAMNDARAPALSLNKTVMQPPIPDDELPVDVIFPHLCTKQLQVITDDKNNTDLIPLLWLLLILHCEFEIGVWPNEVIFIFQFNNMICDNICNPSREITSTHSDESFNSPLLSYFQFLKAINWTLRVLCNN